MTVRPVGLLIDTVYDNTGDKAIRLALEGFLRDRGILYEVLNPLRFDPSMYSRLIIGGGHLIRDPHGGYYDGFRVPGPHVLNAVGLTARQDLDYLREYDYVSVRSTADRERLAEAVPDIVVVPCVSLLLEGEEADVRVKRPAIGLQFSTAAFPACDGVDSLLRDLGDWHKLFVPLMHYANDRNCMQPLAEAVPGSEIAPYLQPRQVLTLISQLDALVSCSLHGCIFAYSSNVPFLALDSHGAAKIREFMEDRGLEEWLFRDAQDLARKLPRLLNERPDYSESIAGDTAVANEHLRRIESIVRHGPVSAALPSVQQAGVAAHIQRIQTASRERDFELARLRSDHSLALARKDAVLAGREHTIAMQKHLISERGAALSAREALLAEKDAALARKDALIAQKDTHIADIEAALHEANVQTSAALQRIDQITNTAGYRLLERVRRPIRWLAPEGSRRRAALSPVKRGLNAALTGRWWPFRRHGARERENDG